MSRTFDALVLGGGLFGAFTALFLARMGQRVALFERGHIGAQSSGANFGGLRLQGRSPEQYPLSLVAQAHWENFECLTGEGCEYDRTGMTYFARDVASCEKLLKYAETARSSGLEIEIFEGEQLRRHMPMLHVPEGTLASFSPRCATANPRLATPAVVRAMVRAGGALYETAEVTKIDKSENGFTLSGPTLAPVSGPVLVNAAGAWAGAISTRFGEGVPLFSAGPPQFVTEPLPYMLRPMLYAIEGDLILRQIPRGNYIFTGYPRTMANAGDEHTFVPPHKTLNGMSVLSRFIPALRHAEIIRVWSGVEGYLPDMMPVLGPSVTIPGLFHAFGGSGGGFQIAPAVGECMAQLICGTQSSVSLAYCSIERFKASVRESEKMMSEFDRSDARN